ncbi:MAG TPA: Fur family transcriptional regulator [Bacillota bacterium]|jgi:Fe2+ or Zn2+ uptake regulation protein|nr:transcriptional repressor [Fastidiosipila sp.]HPX93149.1 Fur family transcriptional regulator [Bacillota bacterium]HQB81392.1 Fur family transcriptional regulator [Bacillota bacterium]
MGSKTVDLLKEHGINPSSQRVHIYHYLAASKEHPTVDDIYAELQKDGHLFSRATVYNTVNLFLEKGLIRPVKVEAHEMRFDATPGFHAHFKCESCGLILDIPMKEPLPDDTGGLEIRRTSVIFSGLCGQCLESQGGRQSGL